MCEEADPGSRPSLRVEVPEDGKPVLSADEMRLVPAPGETWILAGSTVALGAIASSGIVPLEVELEDTLAEDAASSPEPF